MFGFDDAGLLGTAASGLGSLISGFGSLFGESSKKKQERAYNYESQLMEQQNDYNTEAATTAYNRNLEYMDLYNQHEDESATTAYNRSREFYEDYMTAQAQRADLEAAGYNPNALFSTGQTGSSAPSVAAAGSASESATPSSVSLGGTPTEEQDTRWKDFNQSLQTFLNSMQTASNIKQMSTQEDEMRAKILSMSYDDDLKKAQTLNTQVKTIGEQLTNELREKYEGEELEKQLQKLEGELKILNDNIETSQFNLQFLKDYGLVGAVAKVMREVNENKLIEENVKKAYMENEFLPQLLAQNLSVLFSQNKLNLASAEEKIAKSKTEEAKKGYYEEMTSSSAQNSAIQLQYYKNNRQLQKDLSTPEGLQEICKYYNCTETEAKSIIRDLANGKNFDVIQNRYVDRKLMSSEEIGKGADLLRDIGYIINTTAGQILNFGK